MGIMGNYKKSNSEYLKENPSWHVEDSPWKATQILKIIDQNSLVPKTIVEIGCGAGEILNQLYKRMNEKNIHFYGYEISPDAFELCKERTAERLEFFQQDLLQTDNKYDLLLMIDVFEHVDDYIGFITKAAGIAEFKIYHIPLDMSILSIFTNYPIGARKKVGHLHYFMKDTALATLQDAGEEVLDWFYTAGVMELYKKDMNFSGRIINGFRRFLYWLKPDWGVKAFGGFSILALTKKA